jgi:hypothetical protein
MGHPDGAGWYLGDGYGLEHFTAAALCLERPLPGGCRYCDDRIGGSGIELKRRARMERPHGSRLFEHATAWRYVLPNHNAAGGGCERLTHPGRDRRWRVLSCSCFWSWFCSCLWFCLCLCFWFCLCLCFWFWFCLCFWFCLELWFCLYLCFLLCLSFCHPCSFRNL